MISIQIAGAGAGKTYGLAKSLDKAFSSKRSTHKRIFAATYTNAAKATIETEVIKRFGYVPETIEIVTVHSFLLNEIIYPFSPYATSSFYTTASTINLGGTPKSRRFNQKRLKDNHIIHVEEVYEAARRCIDPSMTMHGTKQKKARIRRIHQILSTTVESIYLDEAQDLSKTALQVFNVLGNFVCDVHMIGDPKQAIKHPDSFSDFINQCRSQGTSNTVFLKTNNDTRRIPKQILSLSNRYCYPDQTQTSISEIDGSLHYIESTSPDYSPLISGTNKSTLVYIDSRKSDYATHKNRSCTFHPDIEEIVIQRCGSKDPNLFLRSMEIAFTKTLQTSSPQKATSELMKALGIPYRNDKETKRTYAKIIQSASDNSNARYHILSIDRVKGLEADTCVLVLTPNTFRYLSQEVLLPTEKFNKEWKRLYVALTRAKRRFIVALDHNLFRKSGISIDTIRQKLVELGFSAY